MALCSIIGIVFIGLFVTIINSPGKLTQLKDEQGNIIPDSISEKAWVEINGIEQGMFIRGENRQNPVILYLHGGPGTPMLQFITYLEQTERLEKYFTVCYWDQRGSGMTYEHSADPSTMTLEQMVEDTREVTEFLKQRFDQDKIYLIGHSWGSYLGVKTIEKYPENYLAYIGIGQITNQTQSERLAYEYMLNRAKETNDQAVIDILEEHDPYSADFPTLDYLIKWNGRTSLLNKYKIGHLRQGLAYTDILKSLLVFKGYTVSEKINWLSGADSSMVHLFPILLQDDLFTSSVKFEIPFYIIQGAYDYQVSQVLAEQYLDAIEAPKKGFFSFTESAHSPNMEEPERFIEIIRKIASEHNGEK